MLLISYTRYFWNNFVLVKLFISNWHIIYLLIITDNQQILDSCFKSNTKNLFSYYFLMFCNNLKKTRKTFLKIIIFIFTTASRTLSSFCSLMNKKVWYIVLEFSIKNKLQISNFLRRNSAHLFFFICGTIRTWKFF